jgi:hypothetical protein
MGLASPGLYAGRKKLARQRIEEMKHSIALEQATTSSFRES